MSYRLALDLGTNSIGWCVLKLNEQGAPAEITRSGVRIFKDGRNPKDKTSLAVARRLARQQRRRNTCAACAVIHVLHDFKEIGRTLDQNWPRRGQSRSFYSIINSLDPKGRYIKMHRA